MIFQFQNFQVPATYFPLHWHKGNWSWFLLGRFNPGELCTGIDFRSHHRVNGFGLPFLGEDHDHCSFFPRNAHERTCLGKVSELDSACYGGATCFPFPSDPLQVLTRGADHLDPEARFGIALPLRASVASGCPESFCNCAGLRMQESRV